MPRRLKTSELSELLPMTKDWTLFTWMQAMFYLWLFGPKIRSYIVTIRMRGNGG